MPSYLVVNANVTDPEGLAAYSAAVRPTLAGHKLVSAVVTNNAEAIEGTPAGNRLVIMEFADRAALRAWYDSPEYQAVIGMRHAATEGFAVIFDTP